MINELADNQLTHVIGENNNGEEVVITLRKPLYPESFVRQQQAEIDNLASIKYVNGVTISNLYAEIEALKNGLSSAYWHDTFVEVKKPNSDLIYRFRLDNVCEHGTYDGACKECYIKEQAK